MLEPKCYRKWVTCMLVRVGKPEQRRNSFAKIWKVFSLPL